MINSRNILITGGAGFIGSHLADALVNLDYRVVVLDNLSTGSINNVNRRAKFYKSDILNLKATKVIINNEKIDTIFHQAARVTIRDSINKFYEDARTNLMGTLSLLETIRQTKRVKHFIFASSMAVYADSPKPKKLNENYKLEPISPYGISKLVSEKYVIDICNLLGVRSVVLRYFNTYGTRQSFTPYVGVITIFINRLLKNEPPIIFGNGNQTRDLVSVSDVVQANLKALKFNGTGQIFNVGSGRGRTVKEIANLLCSKIKLGIKPVYASQQPGELKNSIADIKKARQLLQYKPSQNFVYALDGIIAYIKNRQP